MKRQPSGRPRLQSPTYMQPWLYQRPIWMNACYYLEYSDYCLQLYSYTHNILTDMSAFFRSFLSNSRVYTKFWTKPFIWITGVDSSNYDYHDWVQPLSYSKYSLLFLLPVVEIEPVTSRWFHSEALSNQMPNSLPHISLSDNSKWIFGTYKLNVAINSWDTPSWYHMKYLFFFYFGWILFKNIVFY